MPLQKLPLFTILAAIVAFAPLGNTGQVANETSRPHGIDTFEVKAEFPRPALLPVQSRNLKDLAPGKLLVASRDLADPNFAHTVVLLVHYDAKSVVGLVLNHRTDLPLSRVFEGLKAAKDRSDKVYLGGPVETPAVFALLQSPKKLEGAEHVFGGIYLINTKPLFEQTISARPDPGGFHVYLGYAGWAKDQLRMEVAQGAWFIFPADAQTIFSSDPDSLWPQMIRKTELRLARSPSADTDQWTPGGPDLPAASGSVDFDRVPWQSRGCPTSRAVRDVGSDAAGTIDLYAAGKRIFSFKTCHSFTRTAPGSPTA